MTDISIVTSLYRSDEFLPGWVSLVKAAATEIHATGKTLEIIPVVNDATETERRIIDAFVQEAQQLGTLSVNPLYVDRETIYASWNRGVQVAQGAAIGFWNADDKRYPEAMIEGHRKITKEGCKLVYFGFLFIEDRQWLGLIPVPHRITYMAPPFEREKFTTEMHTGSFFMFSPQFYQQIGPFDERFRVAGDYDWSVRAAKVADLCPSELIGGEFVQHGGNLSQQYTVKIEDNIVYLKHGKYHKLYPTNTEKMREAWPRWAAEFPLPPEIEEQVLGAEAERLWAESVRKSARHQRIQLVTEGFRIPLRLLIDKTGLRKLMYRLGIVQSPLPYT